MPSVLGVQKQYPRPFIEATIIATSDALAEFGPTLVKATTTAAGNTVVQVAVTASGSSLQHQAKDFNVQQRGAGNSMLNETETMSTEKHNIADPQRPWKLDKEIRRKERIGRLANDIIVAEASKLIEEAYRKV